MNLNKLFPTHNFNPFNTEDIICYTSPNEYIIVKRDLKSILTNPSALKINRITKEISEIEKYVTNLYSKRAFSSFLGILTIEDFKFIVFCEDAFLRSSIENLTVYEISSVYFLEYCGDNQLNYCPQRKSIYKKLRQLRALLKEGFYYSYDINLTQAYQFQYFGKSQRFTWNAQFLRELQKYKINDVWCIPIIQGYVQSFQVTLKDRLVQYLLISRRSSKNAGTRFFNSGLQQSGYVANFIQTQQIIIFNDFLFSDVQVRGTAPVFFKNHSKIILDKKDKNELQSFKNHIQKLKTRYGNIFCLNILSKQNDQVMITKQYQKNVQIVIQNDKTIKYFYQHLNRGLSEKQKSIQQLIKKVSPMKMNLRYFIEDKKNNKIIQRAAGVFRTNCLDCLTNTNNIQMRLALITVDDILRILDINFPASLITYLNKQHQQITFMKKFKQLWEQNNNKLSYFYIGKHHKTIQHPTKNSQSVTKKMAKSGLFLHPQNPQQIQLMSMIDALLQSKVIEQQQQKSLIRLKNKYSKQKIQICIIVGRQLKENNMNKLQNIPQAQVIIISLQLHQKNVITKFATILQKKYVKIAQYTKQTNTILIYSLKNISSEIIQIENAFLQLQPTMSQFISSKCITMIRINLRNNSISFVNCDLGPKKNNQTKMIDLKSIHTKFFQKQGQDKIISLLNDDAVFLMGNIVSTTKLTKIQSVSQNEIQIYSPLKMFTNVRKSEIGTQKSIYQKLMEYREYEEQQIKLAKSYGNNNYNADKINYSRIIVSRDEAVQWKNYEAILNTGCQYAPTIGQFIFQIQTDFVETELKIFEMAKKVNSYQQPLQEQQNQDDNFVIDDIDVIDEQNNGNIYQTPKQKLIEHQPKGIKVQQLRLFKSFTPS